MASPGWPSSHLPGRRLTAGPRGREGGFSGAEEGPNGAGGGDSRWARARRGCKGWRRCGASASHRRRARWAAADPGEGRRPLSLWQPRAARPEPAGGRQRSAGSIHSRGSASFPGLQSLPGRVRGECAARSGRGPRAEASAASTDPEPPQASSCGPPSGLGRGAGPRPPPGPPARMQLRAAGRSARGVWCALRCAGLRGSATILCEGMPPSPSARLRSRSVSQLPLMIPLLSHFPHREPSALWIGAAG